MILYELFIHDWIKRRGCEAATGPLKLFTWAKTDLPTDQPFGLTVSLH